MSLTAPIVGGKGTVPLPDSVFGVEVSGPLLHEVAKAEAAGRRQGTHATKTRGMVAGGRAKPFRQKGTGRARQGTTRAPQFTGGGTVFGPQPRSYAVKVNRKAYRKARCMGLTQHAQGGTIGVFEADAFAEPKTKDALRLVDGWGEAPLVVVVHPDEEPAALSFRNIPRSAVLTPSEVGLTELLWARRVLISKQALEQLVASLEASPRTREAVA
jgi:large subunit ribosomal protein L4